jgi:signal transduction histidine kinase
MSYFERFMPHGYCYLWRPDILWTHVISDLVIMAAYYSIPIGIVYFIRRREEPDLPIIGWLFAAFILLCGTTHGVAIWNIWHGDYGFEGLVKAVTAAVSIATAVVVWRVMPSALQIPTPKMLQQKVDSATADLVAANAKLGEANAELENFVAVASHDLKEPLRTLSAFSQLLKTDLGEQLSENARTDLSHITAAARRMQLLIANLLDLTLTSRAELSMENLPAGDCANAALRSLEARVAEVHAVIERDRLPVIRGDRTLLTQVYQNLICNALKFTRDGLTPRIRLTAEETSDGEVILGVADNGIGIEPAMRERIFEPFERLHANSSYEGAGIGLSICRRAISRLGGRIWVEESPGGGTHFRFTLRRSTRVAGRDEPSISGMFTADVVG